MDGLDDPVEHRKYLGALRDILERATKLSELCGDVIMRPEWYVQTDRIGNMATQLFLELKCLIADAHFCAPLLWTNEHELNLNGGRLLIIEHARRIASLGTREPEAVNMQASDVGDDDIDDVVNHVPLSAMVMSAICEASYVACFAHALALVAERNNIEFGETVAEFYDKLVSVAIGSVDKAIDVDALGFGWKTLLDDGLVLEKSLLQDENKNYVMPLQRMSEINQATHYLRTMWRCYYSETVHIETLQELLYMAIGRLMFAMDRSHIDVELYRIKPDTKNEETEISPAFFADYFLIFESLHVQRTSVLQDLAEVTTSGEVYQVEANGVRRLAYCARQPMQVRPSPAGRSQAEPVTTVFDVLVFALRVCQPAQYPADGPTEMQTGHEPAAPPQPRNSVQRSTADERYQDVSIALARASIPSIEEIMTWARKYNAEVEATSSELIKYINTHADSLHVLPADAKLAACWEPNGDTRPLGVLHWRLGQPFINKLAERVRGGPGHILAKENPDTNPLVASVLMMLLNHAHKNSCPGANPVPIDELCLLWMNKIEELEGEIGTQSIPAIVQLHGTWCVTSSGHRTKTMTFTNALRVWMAACYYLEMKRIAMFPIKPLLTFMKRMIARGTS